MDLNSLKEKLASDYIDIMRYSQAKQLQLQALLSQESIPAEIHQIALAGKRIGYIIRTCCPFTAADIELAQQAADTLNLDKLVFIIWPFRYLNGYHSALLNNQEVANQPQEWEERMEILRHVLASVNDDRLTILEASKEWFLQSEQMESANDPINPFWTGTWFVVRKLQYLLNQIETKEYFYCCSEDQFNPNLYSLIKQGQEKIWKDYSILQQLALHHVFVVPKAAEPLHKFVAPEWSSHKVIFGTPLKSNPLTNQKRTNKTINMVNVGCVGGVANYLIRRGLFKGDKPLN
jgi:hypothetical protein